MLPICHAGAIEIMLLRPSSRICYHCATVALRQYATGMLSMCYWLAILMLHRCYEHAINVRSEPYQYAITPTHLGRLTLISIMRYK